VPCGSQEVAGESQRLILGQKNFEVFQRQPAKLGEVDNLEPSQAVWMNMFIMVKFYHPCGILGMQELKERVGLPEESSLQSCGLARVHIFRINLPSSNC
jgi:hypothetical protein